MTLWMWLGLWAYSAAAHVLRSVAWLVLWWRGRKLSAYRERWNERRARQPWPVSAREGILIHAASMGEVSAAAPLVEALLAQHPDLPLVFTCSSPTASALISQRFAAHLGQRMHHAYLPFDTPGAVRRLLRGLRPRMLVVMETELWPNLLITASRWGVLVVVANARLSARSAAAYRRWGWLTRRLLASIDLLLAQDAATRDRFVALGLPPARSRVTGSLKFDSPMPANSNAVQAEFAQLLAGRPLWVAASTHEGEELAVLQALAQVQAQHPRLLLVLVPRHPQRFDAVAGLLAQQGLRHARLSEHRHGPPLAEDTAVLLGDSMGELRVWLALAQWVFMGGSLVPHGGHNPLEAMEFGAPLLAGPHVFNFAEAFAALAAADALRTVADAAELAHALNAWLTHPSQAQAMGERGRQLYLQHRGATQRGLGPLQQLLAGQPRWTQHPWRHGEIWADPALFDQPDARLFDPAYWQGVDTQSPAPQLDRLLGQASGRGTAWFVRHAGHELVLRHYYRGGLMAKLVRDRVLWQATPDTRAMAEFTLLRRMRAWGLAVPRPAAARVRRHWVRYQSDILVERIAGAQDVATRLTQADLPAAVWHAVGVAVARLHGLGVEHSDLNCHNILLDAAGTVWLIDFDKCQVRAPGAWQAANLARLQRSLRKEARRQATWHWQEDDWAALLRGYHTQADPANEERPRR